MQKHRDEVIKRMQSQLSKAKYRDLTDALDKLTKNIQLLSGKATANLNSKVVILPERKENEHMDADASPEAGA